jgi:hypothetical protein
MGKNETHRPEQKLTPREANLVATLLTGCTVRAAAPGIDWSLFSESQLAIIEPVFRSIEEQKKQG